jgi:hypothetical protein
MFLACGCFWRAVFSGVQFPARALFARVSQITYASADSHRPRVQIAAAAGFCVHNRSRL